MMLSQLPIKFRRSGTGQYTSECGLFFVHRTEQSGRWLWWTTHLPSKDMPLWPWCRLCEGPIGTSLEGSIRALHVEIARGIVGMIHGFQQGVRAELGARCWCGLRCYGSGPNRRKDPKSG